ncbi:hypothetical protein MCOR25_010837, partial [Pyricularia grisea]
MHPQLDPTIYTVFRAGECFGQNIIIATLPAGQKYGTGSAAALANQVKKFFPNLWFGLLLGVAAGLPNLSRTPLCDIRLRDALLELSDGESAGLVAYDLGKETTDGGFQPLPRGQVMATIETIIRSAIGSIMQDAPDDAKLCLKFYEAIKNKEHAAGTFADPDQQHDKLYVTGKDGVETKREELRDTYDLIGLEMEAAGTMNRIPVGVFRGACDYGDLHKNKDWQPYAAAKAAAYAKAVLREVSASSSSASDLAAPSPSASPMHSVSDGSVTGRDVMAG